MISRHAFSRAAAIVAMFVPPTVSSYAIGELPGDARINRFVNDFAAATTPVAKRNLVIQAIDDGIIKRGLTLAATKQLFGNELKQYTRDPTTGKLVAAVFFEPVIPPPNSLMSALQRGWYIDLVFGIDDKVVNYYLSNVQK